MVRRGLIATALACAGLAQAAPENITRGELALMPPVCQDVQAIPVTGWGRYSRESPRANYWESIMGDTFWAMHHYCWALIHLQRSKQVGTPRSLRAHMVRTAISDFHYVIQNAAADFVLLPELYFRIGEAHAQLGEYPQAIAAFDRSRAVKPDYWPPYVSHATMLASLGVRAQAREILESGLRVMPDEPNLQAALRRIGGGQASAGADAQASRRERGPSPVASGAQQ